MRRLKFYTLHPPVSEGTWIWSRNPRHHLHLFHLEFGSVFESATAAGSTNEVFEQVAIDLPESSGLGHLCQVIDAEPKAELFQILNNKRRETTKHIILLSVQTVSKHPHHTLNGFLLYNRQCSIISCITTLAHGDHLMLVSLPYPWKLTK